MITITYNGVTLGEHNIFSVNPKVFKAMIAESLQYDTITAEICVWPDDDFPDGWLEITDTSTIVYNDGITTLKFYPKTVEPLDRGIYRLEGVSVLGLLVDQRFPGKLYQGAATGDTVATVIADIMGDYPYTVDAEVGALLCENYLPPCNRREALRQVLYAFGISLMKDSNGDPVFRYSQPDFAWPIGASLNVVGGSIEKNSPVTEVRLIEHSYTPSASVQTEVFFDNTDGVVAVGQKIEFDEPIQESTLQATGTLTIDAHTVNSVTVSGTGTLTGKHYLHVRRLLVEQTNAVGPEKILQVEDAYMVSPLNSFNALKRIASYESKAQIVRKSFYVADYRYIGALVRFADPLEVMRTGLVRAVSSQVSKDTLSDFEIATNWMPDFLGNDFSNFVIIATDLALLAECANRGWPFLNGSTPISLAAIAGAGKPCRIVLFSGMQGGEGGSAGEGGGNSQGGSFTSPNFFEENVGGYQLGLPGEPGAGGPGGPGGPGGGPGRYLEIAIAAATSDPAVFTFGAGGPGGPGGTKVFNAFYGRYDNATLPEEGDPGEDSTLQLSGVTYSTEDGSELGADYINMLTGDVIVPLEGEEGPAGWTGGPGGPSRQYALTDSATYDYSTEGKAPYKGGDGTTWRDYADPSIGSGRYWHVPLAGGSGYGGARGGQPRSLAQAGSVQDNFEIHAIYPSGFGLSTGRADRSVLTGEITEIKGAKGANGVNGTATSGHPAFGGGKGGPGGGGGGGAPAVHGYTRMVDSQGRLVSEYGVGFGGAPGNGGKGQQGGYGFAVVYY